MRLSTYLMPELRRTPSLSRPVCRHDACRISGDSTQRTHILPLSIASLSSGSLAQITHTPHRVAALHPEQVERSRQRRVMRVALRLSPLASQVPPVSSRMRCVTWKFKVSCRHSFHFTCLSARPAARCASAARLYVLLAVRVFVNTMGSPLRVGII